MVVPQSVKDALADAEQLMVVAMDPSLPVMPEWRPMRLALWDAYHSGSMRVTLNLRTAAADYAREQAHSAFRAVPELRAPECRRMAAYWRGDVSALADCYCASCARAAFRAVPGLRG